MKHKWHKEIKHLADGGEIEYRTKLGKGIWSDWSVWDEDYFPEFNNDVSDEEYRIKPQAKEPQYLYVWLDKEEDRIEFDHYSVGDVKEDEVYKYIGKIKLEGEEDV
jgi:hypothetical protein